jgi:hypothetical protein
MVILGTSASVRRSNETVVILSGENVGRCFGPKSRCGADQPLWVLRVVEKECHGWHFEP